MGTENYDDSAKGGYSYAEKLAAVAAGNMDPKEIGMTTAEEAKLQVMPEEKPAPKLGTTIIFRAGAVPIELRALWAKQDYNKDRKIIAPETDFDEAAWIEEHKNEYQIQGDLCCGQCAAKFTQTFKDPVLGLAAMLRKAAGMLEQKYTEILQADETKVAQPSEQQNETTQSVE